VLPEISLEQKALSSQLKKYLFDKIKAQGAITFFEFMADALYHPLYGYYRNGSIKFGVEGDFVTAPQVSPLFSQCLARQCLMVLEQDPAAILLEFGAGSGAMALDMLLYLEHMDCLPAAYWILELSSELKQRQKALIQERAPHLLAKVHWLSSLPQEPFCGVVLANEVLDAMPVHKVVWDQGCKESYVGVKDGAFCWQDGRLSSVELKDSLNNLPIPKHNRYETEINLNINGWVASLSKVLEKGLILLVDYGYSQRDYYQASRFLGTIMCHFRQHAHDDPLIYPGVQDITAHVDFTAVAEAADASGLDVLGYIEQGRFLTNCGIHGMMSQDHVEQQYRDAQAIKQLILPNQMGERFKVMALGRGIDGELIGFYHGDQLHQL
jgi:SAM-dependent MidA family methyltransferase